MSYTNLVNGKLINDTTCLSWSIPLFCSCRKQIINFVFKKWIRYLDEKNSAFKLCQNVCRNIITKFWLIVIIVVICWSKKNTKHDERNTRVIALSAAHAYTKAYVTLSYTPRRHDSCHITLALRDFCIYLL